MSTVNVAEDFVDHVHIFTSPAGRIYVQHDRNDGTTDPDPKAAITLLIQAARCVAAAHSISLED